MKKFWTTVWGTGRLFILLPVIILLMTACYKQDIKENVIEEYNITGYLEQFPERFSLITDILYKTETAGFLGAYGTYTFFAPENGGVSDWIRQKGKNDVNDFSKEELMEFVRYHLIRDTVGTARFTDGRIRTPTLFGEFLYTDVVSGQYRINKEVLVTQSNIMCRNGVIHAIEDPLVPPPLSLAELIEQHPDYTIFAEALKATGFYDTLYFERGMAVDSVKRFQTVIAESDAVYRESGIHSFEDLKDKYSQTGDPRSKTDSLWLYMAYHISNGPLFMEDIIATSSLYTLAPQQVISAKFANRNILLNEAEFNGEFEPGAMVIRQKSDMMASNGVLHEVNAPVFIKIRYQVPVYWDMATSPELLLALGGGYRNPTPTALVNNGVPIASSIAFDRYNVSTIGNNNYNFNSNANELQRARANGDAIILSMSTNSARLAHADFTTPHLVAGQYRVWVCYVAFNNTAPHLQVIFNPDTEDEQVMPNILIMNQGLGGSGVTNLNDPNADNLMLAQGFKRYMATVGDYNANGINYGIKPKSGNNGNLNVGRLVGTIDVKTTDRHKIRFKVVPGGGNGNNNTLLDMIHFIPVDHLDQIYPRFHAVPGELFYAAP